MSIDWKLWLTVGGLSLLLVGRLVFSAVCPFMSPRGKAFCVGFSELAQSIGRDVEGAASADGGFSIPGLP